MVFRTFFLALSLLIVGCSRGTIHWAHRPLPTHSLAYHVQEAYEDSYFTPGDLPKQQWWEMLGDPQLSGLIAQALQNNPSMAIAEARIRQALGYTRETRAELFPHLSLSGSVDHYKLSAGEISPEAETGPLSYNQLQSYADFTWALDLWGKYRSQWLAAQGEVYAQQAERALTELVLSLAVAENYFRLLIANERLQVALEMEKNRKETLAFQQQLSENNLGTMTAIENARFWVAWMETYRLAIQQDLFLAKNALQALVATEWEAVVFPESTVDIAALSLPLPSTLPCDLLGRRPEILAQLWRIYSAQKNVYVVQTEFYPNVDLYAFFGLNTIHLSEFFRGRSFSDQIGSAFTLPLFDAGKRCGRLRVAEEEYILRVEEYNQLVLDAVQETIDGMQQWTLARKRWEAARMQTTTQQNLLTLTEERFESNLDSALQCLLSQELYLYTKDQELIRQEDTLMALLAFVRALGGGFTIAGETT